MAGTQASLRIGSADGRLFLDVRGGAGAPPLLYLHGGPGMGCHQFMTWQGDRLSGRVRLIGLDQRGALDAEPPAAGALLSEGDLVDDCEALRESLGLARWALLGHSFGGRVALRYAHRYPDRVSAVVFENPAWDLAETERLQLPAAAVIFEELGDTDAAAACRAVAAGPRNNLWESIELIGRLGAHGRYHDLYVHQPAARQEFDRMAASNPYPKEWRKRGYRHGALLMEAAEVSIMPLLAGLRAPALLIKGMYDLVTGPGQVAGFRTAVPHGVVEVFGESGHFVQLEEPARYAAAVGGFVRRHAR